MNTFNSIDSIERLIFESGLRIADVVSSKQQNRLMIFLNSGVLLAFPISDYKVLATASETQLLNYQLIGDGLGVHWPDIDEDLSLKGFLKEELKKLTGIADKKPDGSGGSSKYAMAA